jgi:phosphoglucomutase
MYEGLLSIFNKYGFYQESLQSITLKGKDGAKHIANLMARFRSEQLIIVEGIKVIAIEDYLTSIRTGKNTVTMINLPRSDVLKYDLEDDSWYCLRPPGRNLK